MIKSLILTYYLINLSFASLLVSLVVFVLFIFSLLGKTNSLPKPQSVFLGYSSLQRGYHCYSLDTNRNFISTDVIFFEDSSFSSTVRPSVPDVLYIPLVLPSPDFPSPPTNVMTRPLKVYTRHPRPPSGLHVDSSLMPQSSHALVLQPSDDLPTSIRKGTRSTSNPHPVYNFLSFHCLSLPYFVFVSTLSSASTPRSTSGTLSSGLKTSNG